MQIKLFVVVALVACVLISEADAAKKRGGGKKKGGARGGKKAASPPPAVVHHNPAVTYDKKTLLGSEFLTTIRHLAGQCDTGADAEVNRVADLIAKLGEARGDVAVLEDRAEELDDALDENTEQELRVKLSISTAEDTVARFQKQADDLAAAADEAFKNAKLTENELLAKTQKLRPLQRAVGAAEDAAEQAVRKFESQNDEAQAAEDAINAQEKFAATQKADLETAEKRIQDLDLKFKAAKAEHARQVSRQLVAENQVAAAEQEILHQTTLRNQFADLAGDAAEDAVEAEREADALERKLAGLEDELENAKQNAAALRLNVEKFCEGNSDNVNNPLKDHEIEKLAGGDEAFNSNRKIDEASGGFNLQGSSAELQAQLNADSCLEARMQLQEVARLIESLTFQIMVTNLDITNAKGDAAAARNTEKNANDKVAAADAAVAAARQNLKDAKEREEGARQAVDEAEKAAAEFDAQREAQHILANEAREQYFSALQAINKLKNQADDAQLSANKAKSRANAAQKTAARIQARIDALVLEIEALKKRAAELNKQAVDAGRAANDAAASAAQVEADIARWQQELLSITNQRAVITRDRQILSPKLKAAVLLASNRGNELEDALATLSSVANNRAEQMQSELQAIDRKLTPLKQQADVLTGIISNQHAAAVDAENKRDAAAADLAALEDEVADLVEQLGLLELDEGSLKRQIANFNAENKQQSALVAELSTDIDGAQKRAAALKAEAVARRNEAGEAVQAAEKAKQELLALFRAAQRAAVDDSEIDLATVELEAAERSLADFRNRENDYLALATQAQDQVNRLSREADSLVQEAELAEKNYAKLVAAQTDLEALDSSLKAPQNDKKKQRGGNGDSEFNVEEVKEKLRQARQAAAAQKLVADRARFLANSAVEALKRAQDQVDEATRKANDAKRHFDQLKDELERKRQIVTQLMEQRAGRDNGQSQFNALRTKIDGLLRISVDAVNAAETAEAEAVSLLNKVAKNQLIVTEAARLAENAARASAAAKESLADVQSQIAAINAKLNEAEMEAMELSQLIVDLQADFDTANRLFQQSVADLEGVNTEIAVLTAKAQGLLAGKGVCDAFNAEVQVMRATARAQNARATTVAIQNENALEAGNLAAAEALENMEFRAGVSLHKTAQVSRPVAELITNVGGGSGSSSVAVSGRKEHVPSASEVDSSIRAASGKKGAARRRGGKKGAASHVVDGATMNSAAGSASTDTLAIVLASTGAAVLAVTLVALVGFYMRRKYSAPVSSNI